MYQRVGKSAYKADLSNTLLLAEYLGTPHTGFKTIHVAGTNGKGSTSHMLASVLQEAGYKVGLYTSPHLKDFRERIKVNGTMVPKRTVSAFVSKHKSFFETHSLSFFEMTVGLAFDYFKKEKVDIAIIEVGLGGRLDSTNIITPEVSVITNIGLDHMRFLGTTLQQIAAEKAGIIKSGIPVVIGETVSETKTIFQEVALDKNALIVFAEKSKKASYASDLKGSYQKKNIKTVLATLLILQEKGWKVSEKSIKNGLLRTIPNTGLMGRWQILKEQPKVICDTAHNKEGLQLVMKQLSLEKYDALHIVLGAVDDKDLDTVLPLFPKEAKYYFCRPDVPRGLKVKVLEEKAAKFGLEGEVYLSVKMAYKDALLTATKSDVVFVGGSTFVVAEVL
ncbi:dihydrofolate synthase / folylpolyglutamate synthase [Ulvibacter litoralis]|uniref:Dihydrofolate synthase/folylpolyglutamate synthase n=2 Tax=Ulvibacter litoralis TaxID=227084 RepID=A0A1G7C244_9FLAO|nr:tetrahydrofolate synthase [Ulvibacter litoralis]SDE33434.1 dihydrofolate synthase / folylpolyglutamate synthase [Ulvibacter litoralis]